MDCSTDNLLVGEDSKINVADSIAVVAIGKVAGGGAVRRQGYNASEEADWHHSAQGFRIVLALFQFDCWTLFFQP